MVHFYVMWLCSVDSCGEGPPLANLPLLLTNVVIVASHYLSSVNVYI